MKNLKLALITLIVTTLAASAVSTFKIGNVSYKAGVEPILTTIIVGEDVTISMTGAKAGTSGGSTGTMTIILKGIKSQIVKGASFDVSTGQNVATGGVNLAFYYSSTDSRGKSTILATDEGSTAPKGSFKITSVTGSSFTATYTAKISDLYKGVTDPLNGQLTPVESRSAGINLSGKFTGAL